MVSMDAPDVAGRSPRHRHLQCWHQRIATPHPLSYKRRDL